MKEYKQVLLAIELESEADALLIEKAKTVLAEFDAELTLVHAVEHLSNYGAAYGVSVGVDIEEELVKEAKRMMQKLGEELQLSDTQQVIAVGPAKQLILEEAKSRNVDLIIVGSHGKHGVRLLLGSTANAILHNAECDVLAVRVRD
ncbi:MAG: universal stress protein [Gammaproteobacteria bacterium]|nr:universal stress protein [Gammaproteobacteria bacterium]